MMERGGELRKPDVVLHYFSDSSSPWTSDSLSLSEEGPAPSSQYHDLLVLTRTTSVRSYSHLASLRPPTPA